MLDIFKQDLSEKISNSIEGQEPSWKNFLSRKTIESLNKDTRQKEEGAKENPTQKIPETKMEKPQNRVQIGSEFELMVSKVAEKTSAPILESGGALAILSTNEYFDLEELKSTIKNPPDGYIFGIGAGNIYSLSHLFADEKPPKAILSVDIMPEVVLAGRVAIKLMKKSSNFNEFMTQIQSKEMFFTEVADVINNEPSEMVCQRLQSVDTDKLFKDIENQANCTPEVGIAEPGFYERISVFAAIRERWDMLHKLASEGKIGIGLADITNAEMINNILTAPEFKDSSNVIYITNMMDHVTDRGTKFGENEERLSFTKPLEVLDNGRSTFIDTTQRHNYNLRASSHLPEYTRDDFKIRSLV
jgi:hypothetical protein